MKSDRELFLLMASNIVASIDSPGSPEWKAQTAMSIARALVELYDANTTNAKEEMREWLESQLDEFARAAGVSESSIPYMAPELKAQLIISALRAAELSR